MTKDEIERQWKHKKDAVANALGKLRVAKQEEREFIAEHGLTLLGLSKGDVLLDKHGCRYMVTGAEKNVYGSNPAPVAYRIKKNGGTGSTKMQTWHGCWTVEKKETPE